MELLRIKHEDFTLTVESTQFQNIKAKGDDDDKLRITFDLQFSHQIYSDYKIIELTILHTFSDTTLDQLSQ